MLSRDIVEDQLRNGPHDFLAIFAVEAYTAMQDWFNVVALGGEVMEGALPRERATFLNRRVVERICKAVEGLPGVVITHHTNQTVLITINGVITLRFKKLSRLYRPMSTLTHRVKQLWHKNERSLPGEFEDWINVTFGWKLSSTGTITELAVVNEYDNQLQWLILVTDEGDQLALHHQMPLLTPPLDEPSVFVARVRPDTERAQLIEKKKAKQDKNQA